MGMRDGAHGKGTKDKSDSSGPFLQAGMLFEEITGRFRILVYVPSIELSQSLQSLRTCCSFTNLVASIPPARYHIQASFRPVFRKERVQVFMELPV